MDLSKIEKPLVLYHGPCRDGFAAAFIASLRFEGAELVEQQYGDPVLRAPNPTSGAFMFRVGGVDRIIDIANRDVLVLDFSYPRDILLAMKEVARSLLVLDHHKTAREALAGLDFAVFDEGRSGAGLALDYFYPGSREWFQATQTDPGFQRAIVPTRAPIWLINLALYVEDWDLWKFKREGVKEVCAYIDTVERSVEAWKNLPTPNEMRLGGTAVLAYQRGQVERIAKHARIIEWPEGKVNIVNSPVLQSEVGEFLYERDPEHASLVWYENERGEMVCSLRSKTGVGPDVGVMAQKRGGGGHRHASGFKGPKEPR